MHNDTFGESTEELGSSAYVVVNQADCLYRPDHNSAVSVTPPYGAIVSIVRAQGGWVLISFCGKQAWAPRQYLSASLTSARTIGSAGVTPVLGVGSAPLVRYTFNSAATPVLPPLSALPP